MAMVWKSRDKALAEVVETKLTEAMAAVVATVHSWGWWCWAMSMVAAAINCCSTNRC